MLKKSIKFIIVCSLLIINLNANFPVGFFQISSDKFAKADSIGIEIVHHYHFEGWKNGNYSTGNNIEAIEYLDEAHEYGLKSIIGFDRKELIDGNFSSVVFRVNSLKNHPALEYWYLADEPDNNFISVKKCKQIYKIIKKIDTEHPVIITISSHTTILAGYEETSDIIIVDSYPIRKSYDISKINNVKNRVKDAIKVCRESSKQAKVFASVQAIGGKHSNVNYDYPTLEETRYMVFSSIIEGAEGIFFYSYNQSSVQHIDNVIKPIVKELDFFTDYISDKFITASLSTPVIFTIRKFKNNYLLIAANTMNYTKNSDFINENIPFLTFTIMPYEVKFFELMDEKWKEIKYKYQ